MIGQNYMVHEIHDALFNPGMNVVLPDAAKDIPRHLAYMAAAVQLERVYGGELNHRDLIILHDLMHYLLLGKHPITNHKRESDFRRASNDLDERQIDLMTDEYKEVYKELLDFTKPKRPGIFYKLLITLMNLKKCYRRYTPDQVGCEQLTNFLLGLAVIDTPSLFKVDKTSDLLTVKTVLALSTNFPKFNQAELPVGHIAFSDMYIGNDANGHLGILSSAVKRMFAMHLPTEKILRHTAYLARFCALMRTASMLSVFMPFERWNECLFTSVNNMITPAKELVDEMALKIEIPQVIQSSMPDLSAVAGRFPRSSRFQK